MIGWMSRRLGRRARGERGSTAAFLAVLAVPLFLLFGLVLDGGRALEAKLRAKDAAAEAARAAANNCDPAGLRGADPLHPGEFLIPSRCLISPFTEPQACQDATDSIAANAPANAHMTKCNVSADGAVVTIGVEFHIQTTFLGIVMRDLTVRSEQSARVYTSQ
jgi:Putative Flp pilus-assembly TadE/G-like